MRRGSSLIPASQQSWNVANVSTRCSGLLQGESKEAREHTSAVTGTFESLSPKVAGPSTSLSSGQPFNVQAAPVPHSCLRGGGGGGGG